MAALVEAGGASVYGSALAVERGVAMVEFEGDRDFSVLEALVEAEQQDRRSDLDSRALASNLGLDPVVACRIIRRLERDGLVDAHMHGGWGADCIHASVNWVTPKGLRAAGAWPAGWDQDAVLERLDELIAAATPAERSRLQKIRDTLADAGPKAAVQLAIELAKFLARGG